MVEKAHTAGWLPHMYEPLRQLRSRIADWFAPAAEASAADNAYVIDMELPGVKVDDIEVSVDGNSLTVKGEKRAEHEERGRTYFFSEREYGAFLRTFRLPPDADTGKVAADYNDGVLTLRISKTGIGGEGGRRISVRQG